MVFNIFRLLFIPFNTLNTNCVIFSSFVMKSIVNALLVGLILNDSSALYDLVKKNLILLSWGVQLSLILSWLCYIYIATVTTAVWHVSLSLSLSWWSCIYIVTVPAIEALHVSSSSLLLLLLSILLLLLSECDIQFIFYVLLKYSQILNVNNERYLNSLKPLTLLDSDLES